MIKQSHDKTVFTKVTCLIFYATVTVEFSKVTDAYLFFIPLLTT